MRYLFIHPVFPGQCMRMMVALAKDPANEVTHLSHRSSQPSLPGVKRMHYRLEMLPGATDTDPGKKPEMPHPFFVKMYDALRHGDAVMKALLHMRKTGFHPDVIVSYAGHGQNFYIKDVFPDVPLLGYFEWFLQAYGGEYNFDPEYPLEFDRQRFIRVFNMKMLADLNTCDAGITPTYWQQSRFPALYRDRIAVIHDGVDTVANAPVRIEKLVLGNRTLALDEIELVTYSARGLEPFRGFPAFMRALAMVQKQRPKLHAVVAGSDENFYSRPPANGAKTHKEAMLRELEGQLDLSRVHFTGWLSPAALRDVFHASRAHVYLTVPYVLSWSLLEAMANGCLIIGSRTAPVQEVIRDGENGLLVDFPGHAHLAEKLVEVFENPARFAPLREQARQTILDHYDERLLLPKQLAWLQGCIDDTQR